jgi:hypothetical protein
MVAENEVRKMLVFEVAIPDMNVDEIENADTGDVPLQFVLGHESNQVTIVWQGNDEYEELNGFRLGAYQGYVVRSHLADVDWIALTADKAIRPADEEDD